MSHNGAFPHKTSVVPERLRGTETKPLYRKVEQTGVTKTPLYMIVVDEGWRESILCSGMYEWAADWLVDRLEGKPFTLGMPHHVRTV